MFACNAAKLLLPFVVEKIYAAKRETPESWEINNNDDNSNSYNNDNNHKKNIDNWLQMNQANKQTSQLVS